MTPITEILEQINQLLEAKKGSALRTLLVERNPADIAEIFDSIEEESLVYLFRILPKELAAETFSYMENDTQQKLVTAMNDTELCYVLDKLYLDDTVDILEEMPANVVKRILANSDSATRTLLNQFLQYPENSVGGMMTIEYVDLNENMTVEDAFAHIRKTGMDKETIYTCYVLDVNRKLVGLVTVRTLLLAEKSTYIKDIMETNIIQTETLADREDAAKLFDRYDLLAIPVVDQENRLVGIVTVDDALDVLQEENTEDFERMAAISPTEQSYLKTPVWEHAKKRIAWLLILMLSATITGSLITKYERAFDAIPLLVAFIPMLMDTGGNCGSQSATLIIRGMALDEIKLSDFFRVIFKEFRVSLLVGIILASINGIRIWIQYQQPLLALTVGITLMGTIILSKIMGCILPMTAKKLHLDPAIMASPLITTIVDTCSILIYFNVAMAILHI